MRCSAKAHGRAIQSGVAKMPKWTPANGIKPPPSRRPAKRKPLSTPEDIEQAIVVRWLEFHKIRFFAVPNGGHRHPAVAAKLKAQGVSRGVPDLVIMDAPPGKHGIVGVALEMKRADGVPSDVTPEQREWLAHFRSRGFRDMVGYGAQRAIAELQALGYGG